MNELLKRRRQMMMHEWLYWSRRAQVTLDYVSFLMAEGLHDAAKNEQRISSHAAQRAMAARDAITLFDRFYGRLD